MTFFHRLVELVELLILYACVQFDTHWASDYRLISQTGEACLNSTSFGSTTFDRQVFGLYRSN
jgi:hypothetical protein